MASKVVFCVTALLFNLQLTRSDENVVSGAGGPAAQIALVQSNIKKLLDKVDIDMNHEVEDIMSRIRFIRDQEVAGNSAKLSKEVGPQVGEVAQLLAKTHAQQPDNDCLAGLDPDYAEAITKAGNDQFRTCVANYPPGGSVNMDISELKQNFHDLEQNTNDAMKECKQEDAAAAASCILSLNSEFQLELARLKESRMKHMRGEASEAEILERVKIEDCMKEAVTNARVKADVYRDTIQKCIAQPPKIDPKVNLALPRQ